MSLIRTTYNKLSARSTALYHRALTRIGIQDCPEMRITAAVTVCVVIYYVLAVVQAIINIAVDAAPVLTALLTQ